MQIDNRLLDDFARVAGGALAALVGVKDEVEVMLRQQLEKVLASVELVPREEFDAVKEMAAKARAEQDALSARIEALEAQLGVAPPKAKPARKRPRRKAKPATEATGGEPPSSA